MIEIKLPYFQTARGNPQVSKPILKIFLWRLKIKFITLQAYKV